MNRSTTFPVAASDPRATSSRRLVEARTPANLPSEDTLPSWARTLEARLLLSLIVEEAPERRWAEGHCGTVGTEYRGRNARKLDDLWWAAALAAPDREAFLAQEKPVAVIARLLGDAK